MADVSSMPEAFTGILDAFILQRQALAGDLEAARAEVTRLEGTLAQLEVAEVATRGVFETSASKCPPEGPGRPEPKASKGGGAAPVGETSEAPAEEPPAQGKSAPKSRSRKPLKPAAGEKVQEDEVQGEALEAAEEPAGEAATPAEETPREEAGEQEEEVSAEEPPEDLFAQMVRMMAENGEEEPAEEVGTTTTSAATDEDEDLFASEDDEFEEADDIDEIPF